MSTSNIGQPLNIPAQARAALLARSVPVETLLENSLLVPPSPQLIAAQTGYYNQCLGDISQLGQCCCFPSMPPVPGGQFPWFPQCGPMQLPGGGGYGADPFLMMMMMQMQGGGDINSIAMLAMMMQQQQQMMMLMLILMGAGQQQGGYPYPYPGPYPGPQPGPCPEPQPQPQPQPQPEPQPQSQRPMTLARAAQILNRYFDTLDTAAGIGEKDGIVGKADIEAMAEGKNPGAPAELVEACKWLLENPAMLNAIDTGDGNGAVDGIIARKDLENSVQRFAAFDQNPQVTGPMTLGRAAAILKKYFSVLDQAAGIGDKDGLIGKPDLEAIVRCEGAPADLRAACQWLLENSSFFDNLETSAEGGRRDGLIGLNDLDTTIRTHQDEAVGPRREGQKMTLARAAQLINQHFDLLDTAANGGRADNRIGKNDLEAIAGGSNPGAPAELIEACRWLIENPAMLNALDTAAGVGDVDGIIGRNDLVAAVQKYSTLDEPDQFNEPLTLGRAAAILKKYFGMVDCAAGRGRPDGLIGINDLEAVVNSPGAPEDLLAACRFLLENRALLGTLETSANGGNQDGLIGVNDLDSYVTRHQDEAVGPRQEEGSN